MIFKFQNNIQNPRKLRFGRDYGLGVEAKTPCSWPT